MTIDYRDLARRYAARHAVHACAFEISCPRCDETITVRGHSYRDAQHHLVEQALAAGWDLDSGGRLGCASCSRQIRGEEDS